MRSVFVALQFLKKKKKKTFHKPAYELLLFKVSANLQQSLSQG
jgi:hypothetical protein